MSEVVLTLKGSGEPPWLVIHTESPNELLQILDELREADVFSMYQEAAVSFAAAAPEPPPTMQQAVQTVQHVMPGSQVVGQYDNGQIGGYYGGGQGQGQQLPQQFQPGGQPEYCNHGQMTFVANGKFGPFWGCPLPKGHPDKCKTRPAR